MYQVDGFGQVDDLVAPRVPAFAQVIGRGTPRAQRQLQGLAADRLAKRLPPAPFARAKRADGIALAAK